jgi:hypothetical protein
MEVNMDATTEVTTTDATTPAMPTPEAFKAPTSITSLIGVLYHAKWGSTTHTAMLDKLLNHDDLWSPEDLQREAQRFCDRERWRIDNFQIDLNDASLSIGGSF